MNGKQILTLYFVFSVVFLLASLFHVKLVANISKGLLIPLVFFNYYFYKNKLELTPVLLLVCCFLGDVFMLDFNKYASHLYMISFGIHHLIFALICYKVIQDFDVKKIIFSAVPVIILWHIYFNHSIKDIFGAQMGDLYPFIIGYSIALSAFVIISLVNYFNNETKENLFSVMIAVCFLIGDIIMVVNNHLVELFFFDFIVVSTKIIAYFFLLKFIKSFSFIRLY